MASTVKLNLVRVFLSTPGGLEAERKLFHDAIHEFNENRGYDHGFAMIPVGWERIPPSVVRPQSPINQKLRGCDYLVVLIWDRWGTSTSKDGVYSSGVQEELYVAAECLGDGGAEMRDIAIYFKDIPVQKLTDQDPQLSEVLRFKAKLEETKSFLYQTFENEEGLRGHLRQLFRSWMGGFGPKEPKEVKLPTLDDDTARPLIEGVDAMSRTGLLSRARAFADRGLNTQAEVAFVSAVADHDRDALIAYAKFLRRTGRLEKAFRVNKQLLKQAVSSPSSAESHSTEMSDVLANMGLIRRKQGRLRDSVRHLREAVKAVSACSGREAVESKAYALDNLGLTLRRMGDQDEALKRHAEALELREEIGDVLGKSKAQINVARICKDRDELAKARRILSEAINVLKGCEKEKRTLANAYSTVGEIARREGHTEEALKNYLKTLGLNESISHNDGVAIACGQLAQLLLIREDVDEARKYARRCRDENAESGNREGVAVALRTLGDVKFASDDFDGALSDFREAARMFEKHGNIGGAVSAKLRIARALSRSGDSEAATATREEAESLAHQAKMSTREFERALLF